MRILLLSNSEWDDNNSFGNTFSNFFEGMNDVEFANIYFREGCPNTKLCHKFIKISDRNILKYVLRQSDDPAEIVCQADCTDEYGAKSVKDDFGIRRKIAAFLKKKRYPVVFLIRELIWSLRNPFTDNVQNFIEEFKPDILFLPTYPYNYINKFALDVQNKYSLPMVSYMSDDEYSLRVISFLPLFWTRRFIQRKWVIRSLRASDIVYVISELQKKDIKRDLDIEAKVLTKSYVFHDSKSVNQCRANDSSIRIVYAGNIDKGRLNTLRVISKAITEISDEVPNVTFKIFSATSLSKKEIEKLSSKACSFEGSVPYKELLKIQEDADIVIHVEGYDFKSSLQVRESFSTKLVDFFHLGKCIFAAGNVNTASMSYLIEEDAAVVAVSRQDIYVKLKEIISDATLRECYAQKSFQCGVCNHDKGKIQKMLCDDLGMLID